MYDFLLQTSLFISLGVVVYVLARAVPRVDEAGEVKHPAGKFDQFLSRLPLKEIDERLDLIFEKFLRRAKVLIMKSDNLVNQYLGRLKKANGNVEAREAAPDLFKELNDDKKE